MKTLTPADRIAATAIVADIIARPSFAVATLWIERCGAETARGYPTSVGRLCFNLERTWGAVVEPETMAVALEARGFKVSSRSFGDLMAPELATNIARSSLESKPWRTERPRPERWAWAKDVAL